MAQNTNIQSPLLLDGGQGLIHRESHDWVAGEYSALTNVEIIDGGVQLRRPIIACQNANIRSISAIISDNATGLGYFTRFGGFSGPDLLIPGLDSNWHYGEGEDVNKTPGVIGLWKSSVVLLAPPEGAHPPAGDPLGHWEDTNPALTWDSVPPTVLWGSSSIHKVLWWFSYKSKVYWLTHRRDNTVDEYYLYEGNSNAAPTIKTLILSNTNGTLGAPVSRFIKAMIYKDRLWILNNDKLYYSKSTDPTKFALVDNGGFLDTDSGTFYDMVAQGDNIYLATSKGLYTFNYTADPGKDYLFKPIAFTDRPVFSLLLHQNQLYVSNANSIHIMFGSTAELVLDHTTVDPTASTSVIIAKLETFNDCIIYGIKAPYVEHNARDYKYGTRTGYMDLYGFNVDNKTIWKLDFKDNFDVPSSDRGRITDFIYNPAHRVMVFASTYFDVATGMPNTRFYEMGVDRVDKPNSLSPNLGLDRVYYDAKGSFSALKYSAIPYEVNLINRVPDGTEHLLKKIRFVRLQGQIPRGSTEETSHGYFAYGFDSPNYHVAVGNEYVLAIGYTPHRPLTYIVKINQKTRALSLFFRRDRNSSDNLSYNENNQDYYFSLTDIRLYWTYTGHHGKKDYSTA